MTSTRKRDQLVGLARRAHRRARATFGSSANSSGIVRLDHAGAGAGRRHDVIVGLEGRRSPARRCARVVARSPELKAGWPQQVCAGTSTRAAGVLQQLHRGEADRRADQIDEAGDEQGDARPHRTILCAGTCLRDGDCHVVLTPMHQIKLARKRPARWLEPAASATSVHSAKIRQWHPDRTERRL